MQNLSIKLFVVAAMGLLSPFSAQAQDRNNEDEVVKMDARSSVSAYRKGEIIVKFKGQSSVAMRAPQRTPFRTSSVQSVDNVFKQIGATDVEELMPLSGSKMQAKLGRAFDGSVVSSPKLDKLYLVRFDTSVTADVYDAIEKLKALPEVEYAEPNAILYALADTTQADTYTQEPLYSQQWGLPAINMPKLWAVPTITSKRPVIAILDTGVDITHPDLKDNIWSNISEGEGESGVDDDNNGFADDVHGWDFINGTGNIGDWNGHGTHCAGIAAAVGNNGVGITGANPDALIMPVTVIQSDGTGDIATIIKGIDYATANGADVLNMSFGSYSTSLAFEQTLAHAYQTAILVAAAGNDGYCLNHKHQNQQIPMPMFPAAYNFVLGVQASNESGRVSWSNYDDNGPFYTEYSEDKLYNYELQAPGKDIISTYPGGNYKTMNGTSMAAPLVAGALSRLIQVKDCSNKEVLFGDLINSTTSTGDLDIYKAYGIMDADRTPSLSIVTYEMDDSTSAGDGDGNPDAGETIDIYPVVRNAYGEAKNIQVSIELAENEDASLVEFINKKVSFGYNLSAYAKARSLNPLRVKISDNCADNRHIQFIIKATCDGTEDIAEQAVTWTVENGVEIGGIIKENTTLYPNVHYIVTKNLAIPEGVTLTIKPGTKLEFRDTYFRNNGTINATGKVDSLIVLDGVNDKNGITGAILDLTGFSYTVLMNSEISYLSGHMDNNIFKNNKIYNFEYSGNKVIVKKCNFFSNLLHYSGRTIVTSCNFVQNVPDNVYSMYKKCLSLDCLYSSNIFNNGNEKNMADAYIIDYDSVIFTTDTPNYFGSSKESIVRKGIFDIYNDYSTTEYDLSNMLTRPNADAHGIVWKVVVNGYDAQDEADMLSPLGVGKHKFEVYFNRPMNTSVAPTISMGVRSPYTQTAIAEDGVWSVDSMVYTAYLTITGKSAYDGVNRIRIYGAKDNENFEIPEEAYRFNVNVQAAGSMSAGFMGEAGLGKVQLTWENPEDNFDDMLGYNLYRYQLDANQQKTDSVKINTQLLEPEETTFTDYYVTPGNTYYYYYKVMRTDLAENDPSKTVAVTPLTSVKGDANGSASVDVADVITTVNYAAGMNPKPFIFEAADVNADQVIDILDVVGIIQTILNPNANAKSLATATATYTLENGVVYVDSPVDLAGVQVQLTTEDKTDNITASEELNGFENAAAWLSDYDYLFLAYSMSGKTLKAGRHAILNVGEGCNILNIRLSDAAGNNVEAILGETDGISTVNASKIGAKGVYTLQGVRVSGDEKSLSRMPHGVYIVNGQKTVK